MTAKQQPTPADTTRTLAASASKNCNGNNDAKNAAPAAAAATPLVDEGVRHSAVDINIDNNDDEEEEEMISLGLSVSGNMIEDGSDVVVGSVDGSRAMAMVGKNRKSVLPATPAAASNVVNSQQHPQHQHHSGGDYEGYGPPMRRTPGPGSVAHQARHRRTPGAGQNGHNDEDELDRSHARTPIMSGGGGNRPGKTPHKLSLLPSSIVTPSTKSQHYSNAVVETPILSYSNHRGSTTTNHQPPQRQLYTPAHFTLAKNAELHMDHHRSDAFSPATIRMTDSLEKILTDDDDFLDSRHRLIQQQQANNNAQQSSTSITNQTITSANNGNSAIFDPYVDEKDLDIAANDGTFRRIQSTGYDSADEEIEEMKDLELSNIQETDTMSQKVLVEEEDDDEEEEEAEISQINDNEEINGDDDEDETKSNVSISRPKPLNFNRGPTSSGSLLTVSASSGGAFKPAKRVVVSTTTTPRPQRTLPRHAAQAYPSIGAHRPNHTREGFYYPPHQPQQGYFGHPQGEGRVVIGMEHHHPQHAASNMMFNEHQSRLHLHYSHDQSHHPYGPMHQHQHSSQNYHLSPLPSPQHLGYADIPPMGVVSPLTLPPDYSQGHGTYDYHTHANPSILGRGSHPHHVMHNQSIHGAGGMGGNNWWRGSQPGHPDGFINNSMTSYPHHDHLQLQGGMGMMPVAGHTSPDFSYHEMMGVTPPFNLPHHHNRFPRSPPPTSTNYPRPNQQKMSPSYHPTGVAPNAARPRTKPKENNGPRVNTYYRKSQSSSPTMQQGSPDGRSMRPRKDSTASANSAFSGEDELGNAYHAEALSPPKSTSAVRQTMPRLNTNSSSDDGLERNDWFYHANRNNNSSYSTKESRIDGASFQHQSMDTPQRVRKGSYELPGTGGSNNRIRLCSVEEMQQHDPIAPSVRSPTSRLHPCSDHPPYKYGEDGRSNKDGTDNEDGKQSRGEFVLESPSERQAFKEFGKQFRLKKNESLAVARDYALACLSESNRDVFLSSSLHWRVHLELADLAKRSNQINTARSHYRHACALQPHASQGWLEHSKLEEESGNLRKCASILQEGLSHCTANENLLIMAIKFYERMGELDQARQLLSRLKHLSIDKSWKTMLEGAMLEARVGRYSMAREVLKFLTHNIPWYGPLYLAHTKLERDYGSPAEAFSIVERGLKELPRYGPLYFQAFRLLEKEDLSQNKFDLPRTTQMISRADSISRELLWKVHLEAAQMHERAAERAAECDPTNFDIKLALQSTRRSYAKAIALCPYNLSWKVWLSSGRTELSCGNVKGARELFFRAHESVSDKGQSTVLLECARLEEYCGDLALSRSILCKARQQFGNSDWKVWLSAVHLESRCGLRERAKSFAQDALNIHRGTGRLWAALIQLCYDDGELYQTNILKCALQVVPKSGEVWCEGARIYLNPFSPTFDLQAASRHLYFAARFTPQYGDSFIEHLRLHMIDQWLIPLADPFINTMHDAFVSCSTMSMEESHKLVAEHTRKAAGVMKNKCSAASLITMNVLDTSDLELRCSSADPNYGHLWFLYRNSPIDTAREVISQAKIVMADSIIDYSYLYIAAIVRRAGLLMLIERQAEQGTVSDTNNNAKPSMPSAQGLPHPNSHNWEDVVDRHVRSAPTLNEMLPDIEVGSILFTSGCSGDYHNWEKLSLTERRRILFGSDSLLN